MEAISAPTQYPPSELFQREQPCIAIGIERRAHGFHVGDRVRFRTAPAEANSEIGGTIRAFTCTPDRKPAAYVEIDNPASVWVHIAPLSGLTRAGR